MTIDDFRNVYLRLCKEHHTDPQESVLKQLSSSHKAPRKGVGGYCLNLSALSLASKTCTVLGQVLGTDRTFTELLMNDCMLLEESVRTIAHGLASNVAIKKLDLKGNNIRGTAAEALGRMLKDNKSLLSLCLEWNAMGMIDTSFGVFCESLNHNSTLQVLDLRNNQITHEGAAELAMALRKNTTIRAVDLRWNNIGLIGGRSLVAMLDDNKTLVRLDLAGNNVPNDIIRAIETAIANNADRASLTNDYMTRQKMLSKEVQMLQKDRANELADLLNKLDKQDDAIKKSQKSASTRINQLQDALDDRKDQFNTLATKLALAESELVLSESKVQEYGALFGKAKEDQSDLMKHHQADLKREREDRSMVEARLNKEIIEVNEKNMQLDNRVDDLERKCKSQQENIFELKEQLSHNQADHKMKQTHFDEMLTLEKQKTKDAYRDADAIKMKEIDRIRRECNETEGTLKERINKLEQQRLELEEEVRRQKNNVAEEKLRSEEHLMMAKQRIKSEEEQRCHQLEEKIRMMQATKDDLEAHNSSQSNTVSELQSKNSNLTIENETLRRKITELNQEISGKNNEMMAEVEKVKIELNQRIHKLEAERQTKAELYDKIARMETEIADLNSKYNTICTSKDTEIMQLKETVKSRELEISRMTQEEQQRAALLTTAIQNYITKK